MSVRRPHAAASWSSPNRATIHDRRWTTVDLSVARLDVAGNRPAAKDGPSSPSIPPEQQHFLTNGHGLLPKMLGPCIPTKVVHMHSCRTTAAPPPFHRKVHATSLAVALSMICSIGYAQEPRSQLLVVRTVVLDPGHGGGNEGAIGRHGTLEKDEVLALAYVVRERLQSDYPDLRVVLTRVMDVDLPLPQRIYMANALGADLFFSLHMNASTNPRANGLEVYYLAADKTMPLVTPGKGSWGDNFEPPPQTRGRGVLSTAGPESLPLLLADLELGRVHADSALVAEVMLDQLSRTCPGRTIRGVRQANFGVLRGAQVPAIVVEVGFISNPAEAAWLRKERTPGRIALAMSRTVRRVDVLLNARGYVAQPAVTQDHAHSSWAGREKTNMPGASIPE